MKTIILIFFAFSVVQSSSQNTFPSFGNVGIGTTSPNSTLDIRSVFQAPSVRVGIPNSEWTALGVAAGNGNFSPLAITGSVILRAFTSKDFIITQQGGGDISFATRLVQNDLSTEATRMTITNDGNVGIGKSDPTDKLEVNGRIHARSVKVDLDAWPDYVFVPEYRLKSLEEVESYIKEHGHLENVPSADEIIVNGLDLGQMDTILMEKIEELTLYLIEKEKKLIVFRKKNKHLNRELKN